MAVRNQDWYNLNESRPYPLQDTASIRSDKGKLLPSHIITDLKLKFPSSLGNFAFLSGITLTDNLVTIVISGSTSATVAASEAPLCSITLTGSVLQGKPYILSPLAAGVSGWIVFGKGIDEPFAARFAAPSQSLISPRAARAYRVLPITGISKIGNDSQLTGIVQLLAGSDIEIVSACRRIPDVRPPEALHCDDDLHMQDVVVIRLTDTRNASRNVLAEYVGECNQRPESYNCGNPQPVEFIGSVSPDCSGNIFIVVAGCARISDVTTEVTLDDEGSVVASTAASGVVLDCDVSLSESCGENNKLPDEDGVLPAEAEGLCSVISMDLESISESDDGLPDEWASIPSCIPFTITDLSLLIETLPSASWVTKAGSWASDAEDGFVPEQDAMPSLLIYDNVNSSICMSGSMTAKFPQGESGSLHSGGIVFGYHETNGYPEFFSLEMHWDTTQSEPTKSLRLRYWKDWYSSDLNTESTDMPEMPIETLVQLTVRVSTPASVEGASLTCIGHWQDEDEVWHDTHMDLSGLKFRPYPSGKWGLIAHRARTQNITFDLY